MKTRLRILAAVFALTAAACGGGTPAATDPAAPADDTASPPASGPQIAPASFQYDYDDVVEYALTLDQTLTMRADGDASGFGDGRYKLPVEMEADVRADLTLRYETSPGPDPGTTTVRLTSEVTNLVVEGTINGEPAADTDMAQLGPTTLPPVDVTVIVDERGNVVEIESSGEDLGALFGGLGSLENLGTSRLGRPVGPAFPEEPVGVGDTWTETTETEGPEGPIVTRATHTVVGTDVVAGRDVLVVESVYETDGFSFDFTDFLRGFLEGFSDAAGEAGAPDEGELQDMLEQLVFRIDVSPTTSTVTSWFDPERGLVVEADGNDDTGMAMQFQGPNEETGAMERLDVDMSITQSVSYRLLGPGA